MTREELTAKLRKLTGKTATDIEALDERVDALEAGAGGGGVEVNKLNINLAATDFIDVDTNKNIRFSCQKLLSADVNDIIEINIIENDDSLGVSAVLKYPFYGMHIPNVTYGGSDIGTLIEQVFIDWRYITAESEGQTIKGLGIEAYNLMDSDVLTWLDGKTIEILYI